MSTMSGTQRTSTLRASPKKTRSTEKRSMKTGPKLSTMNEYCHWNEYMHACTLDALWGVCVRVWCVRVWCGVVCACACACAVVRPVRKLMHIVRDSRSVPLLDAVGG